MGKREEGRGKREEGVGSRGVGSREGGIGKGGGGECFWSLLRSISIAINLYWRPFFLICYAVSSSFSPECRRWADGLPRQLVLIGCLSGCLAIKWRRPLVSALPWKDMRGLWSFPARLCGGRNASQQQDLVAVVLKSLMPAQVLWLIRTLFSPTRLVCELNAWFCDGAV